MLEPSICKCCGAWQHCPGGMSGQVAITTLRGLLPGSALGATAIALPARLLPVAVMVMSTCRVHAVNPRRNKISRNTRQPSMVLGKVKRAATTRKMVREEIAHEIIILIASPRAIKHLAQTRVWESNRAFFTRLDLRTSVCCRWHPPCQPGHPKHIVAYSGKVRYQGPSTVDTAVLDGYAASRPRMGTIWPRKKYLLGHREDFEVLPEQQREDNTAGQLNVARHSTQLGRWLRCKD